MQKIQKCKTYADVHLAVELGILKQIEMSDTGVRYLAGDDTTAHVIAVDWDAALLMTTDYTFGEMMGLGLVWGNKQYDAESDWGVVNHNGTLMYRCELGG